MILWGLQLLLPGRRRLVRAAIVSVQLQGAIEDKNRKEKDAVEDGEGGGDLGDGALGVGVVVLQVGGVGGVEVAAPSEGYNCTVVWIMIHI